LSFLIPDFYDWKAFVILAILVTADLGFTIARGKRVRRLEKELKMSDRLWAKKRGRAFAE
jgi:hypothetical protein